MRPGLARGLVYATPISLALWALVACGAWLAWG